MIIIEIVILGLIVLFQVHLTRRHYRLMQELLHFRQLFKADRNEFKGFGTMLRAAEAQIRQEAKGLQAGLRNQEKLGASLRLVAQRLNAEISAFDRLAEDYVIHAMKKSKCKCQSQAGMAFVDQPGPDGMTKELKPDPDANTKEGQLSKSHDGMSATAHYIANSLRGREL